MSALKTGVVGAAVLAGPTLYGMVQAGLLDPTQAVLRGGVVAVGVAVGASYVGRLVETYQQEHVKAARQAEHDDRLAAEIIRLAQADGTTGRSAQTGEARPPAG